MKKMGENLKIKRIPKDDKKIKTSDLGHKKKVELMNKE